MYPVDGMVVVLPELFDVVVVAPDTHRPYLVAVGDVGSAVGRMDLAPRPLRHG